MANSNNPPSDDSELGVVSKKLNVLIALIVQRESGAKKDKGELAVYLRGFGLEYEDIALILNSSVASVTELVVGQDVRQLERL